MANESIVLNGLDLNDGSTFTIEGDSFTFTPAQAKPLFASNAAADGDVLVREPNYGPAYFDFMVRVEPQADMETALEKAGEVTDAIQSCARSDGGAPVEWTPAGTETTYTWYAELGELAELPVTVTGDAAGWFLDSPVLKVKLTCSSAGETEEKVVQEAVESGAEPQQTVYVKCGGDLPAKATLIATEKSTQDRRHFKYGHDLVASNEGNPATLITAASLVITGFSGSSTTRSGAYGSEKVKRGTAVSQPTTMCGTGAIKHVGSFRVFARVYAASENARFRISYRNGDGPLIPLAFQAPTVIENFSTLDLGEVTFDEAENGEQRSEIRVEVKTAEGDPIEVDLNYLELIPSTLGFGRARGLANNSPTKLLAYDTFLQAEGALKEKELPFGGKWGGAGDAVDFTVIAAEDLARRTEVSDADLNTGRYATAGSEEPTTCLVSAAVSCSAMPSEFLSAEANRLGVIARYGSTEKWLMAVLVASGNPVAAGWSLYVLKRVPAGVTVLDKIVAIFVPAGSNLSSRTISLSVDSGGSWTAGVTGLASVLSGQDSALATGGELAKGKGGIYDAWTPSEAPTRTVDNFTLMQGDAAGRVCFSGKTCRLTDQGFTRQDSEGKYEGVPSIYRGAQLYLQPTGDIDYYNRLVVAMRRNDVDAEADSAVSDKHKMEVLVRERFLAPRA